MFCLSPLSLIVNVLNLKTALFFFAFLPQFVNPSRGPVVAQILFLGLLFAAILYFGDAKRVFVLLHGIVKRSAKLADEDIRLAETRMQLHNRRFERR
ncbi:MAG: type II toxin-antitoxin system RelE/ParE family toxin [Candidatus Acidiferrales bacterium]